MKSIDWKKEAEGRILVIDAEAKGLLDAIRYGHREDVHIICCMDLLTTEEFLFFDPYEMRDPEARERLKEWEGHQDGTLVDGVNFLKHCEAIVSQNFLGYDGLLFEKAFPDIWKGFNYTEKRGKGRLRADMCPVRVMDTLVMSRLLTPIDAFLRKHMPKVWVTSPLTQLRRTASV